MASRNATLAEAVKTALNSATPGTFVLAFTAKRLPVPVTNLNLLKTLTVSVIAASDDGERTGRDVDEHKLKVLIGVEKKLTSKDVSSPDANAEVDQLMLLVEQIDDFWDRSKIAESVGLFLNKTIVTLSDPMSLLTQTVFRGVVAVNFVFPVSS